MVPQVIATEIIEKLFDRMRTIANEYHSLEAFFLALAELFNIANFKAVKQDI